MEKALSWPKHVNVGNTTLPENRISPSTASMYAVGSVCFVMSSLRYFIHFSFFTLKNNNLADLDAFCLVKSVKNKDMKKNVIS